jgi:hypothetical protein
VDDEALERLGDELDARRRRELSRTSAQPLPAALQPLAKPSEGRYGICCSGGGIRSAAFNLGALQVLQAPENRILQRAKYLAAVSGGSYMAAGFAMVAKVDDPETDSDPDLVDDDAPPFHPGSPEEQYLRNRSSYMAPGFGGKLRLVARVILGVLVNLLYLGSILFVVGWIIGWLLYGEVLYEGLREADGGAATATAGWLAVGLATAAAVLGVASILWRANDHTWTRRLLRVAMGCALGAVLVGVLLVAVPSLLEWLRDVPDTGPQETTAQDLGGKSTAAAVGGTSAGALLLSIFVQLRARMNDSRMLARAVTSGREGVTGYVTDKLLPRLRDTLVLAAATIAGPLLLGGIAFLSALLGVVDEDPLPWTVVALVAAAAFFAALSRYGEVTSWSLHPFYRRRLASAFALRRITRDGRPIALERDYSTFVPLSRSGVEPVDAEQKLREWPQLVVCAAANVSDPGATPPGRAVTSFTFSPQLIGGPLIGYVPTPDFERELAGRQRDFTLMAAVAMSGAALAPSMGKLTRSPLRFLLTLGNARLGVWVPNPRYLGQAGDRRSWRPRPRLLLNELLGRNSADARFLYVTDGGHYENLGLVELLRRGCRDVYCFDASGGADIQELGDAIALARTELQVEVVLEPEAASKVVPDDKGIAQDTCATGIIRFPDGQTGTLVYVRSVLTAGAPHDVRAYHELDPKFPHNSTGDQLYTDQRFEAYRALGRGAAERALQLYRAAPTPPPAPSGAVAASSGPPA